MKKLTVLALFICLLFSCNKDTKPLSFKTTETTKIYNADINVLLTKATANNAISKAINTSIKNEIIKAISDSESIKNLEDALNEFDTEFVNFKKHFSDRESTWVLNIESEVTYSSSEVLTIALSIYTDKGGAHGNDTITFLNFNPNTGRLFTLEDIINDVVAFKKLAEKHFKIAIDSNTSENLSIEDFFFGEPFQLPNNIGFTEDGLVLLYNVYEIASYNQGYTEFVIPTDILSPYLKVN